MGGATGNFGRAIIRMLEKGSKAKIPKVRPKKPDVLAKLTN